MVRTEVIAVGKELLIGRTMNSNAHWIGGRLARLGSMISEIATVNDDLGEIGRALEESLRRGTDIMIVVGGLGPTPDDMTLAGVSRALGLGLRVNGAALAQVKEHYAGRGLSSTRLTPPRMKMARLPVGATPLRNDVGTAPGVRMVADGATIFCLPGVPSEMRRIFKTGVEPEVRQRIGKIHRSYVRMKLAGVAESTLAPALSKELRKHPGAYIKSHPRGMKEGASRIDLDVVVLGAVAESAEAEARAISEAMARAVDGMGGRVERTWDAKGGRRWT